MGVPKFFRYISERYPCLSETVKEYQIPEFDNLYLDMNGIIHTCSHPDDNDPHFRITEEVIFKDIFHYVEVLFRMIKPRKLFFMAVDGVAPRAKMNQQRGRRFNAAKEAQRLEEIARKKGEVLPEEARFDSNCITPGTPFMARLHEQLKFFVMHKISTDRLWAHCTVILSGHETPGEGEHKIMDYIRYLRSQPGYNPNTRHCLYGLDADLIMLGLCTHEPHFSLLREEVKFGRNSTKRKNVPEEITFYLLHLSLMREYLEMEFQSLKGCLSFEFNIENIIDDWVLMGFLVGNDFIPHLPNLHITNGALPVLYKTYIKVLPSFGGYINEAGKLHLARFEKFMESLSDIDMENFSEYYADLKYFESKTGRKLNEKERTSYKPSSPEASSSKEKEDQAVVVEPSVENLCNLALEPDGYEVCGDTEDFEPDDIDVESDISSTSSNECMNEEFRLHKRDYYMNKLEYEQVTPDVLRDQAEGYVKAIQWNLNYYYNGCCSWSWYYPHHYAPYISDIKDFANLKIEFDLGKPFRPFEQLLAVLPAASRTLLPQCYQDLMTCEDSPIKKYYPEEFKKDLNGKKQDWEAVVLIPFIDEKLLLEVMEPLNEKLTEEEKKRNSPGPMLVYTYTPESLGGCNAPSYFPPIKENHAKCQHMTIEDIRVPVEKLVKGVYPGAVTDVYYPGFPTFKHLKYTASLERAKVRVFEQLSRGENMIVKVLPGEYESDFIKNIIGRTVHVGWPHLVEAVVVAISTQEHRYKSLDNPGEYDVVENVTKEGVELFDAELDGIVEHYNSRLGIDVGKTTVLVQVKVMIGRKYIFMPQGRATLEKQFADIPSNYPLQTIVRDIVVHDEHNNTYRDISEVFLAGSKCFMLGHPHYGTMGEVLHDPESLQKGRVKIQMLESQEPDLERIRQMLREAESKYMSLFMACGKLSISRYVFSRITGTVFVASVNQLCDGKGLHRVNVGLNLKFNVKNKETPGYTMKVNNTWLYSEKTINLIKEYMAFCPAIFEYLNFHQKADTVILEDLFPKKSQERLNELKAWLKSKPHYNAERQTSGNMIMDLELVQKLEEVIDKFKHTQVKSVTMRVKPQLLYKEDLQTGQLSPDKNAVYYLCDRIINVREGHTVPLGAKGTVIGIRKIRENENAYDVVFDAPFLGGISLGCSEGRGYRLPASAMINISHGRRVYQGKTGVPGKLLHSVQTARQNGGTGRDEEGFWQQTSAFASWNKMPPKNFYPMFNSHQAFVPALSGAAAYGNMGVFPAPVTVMYGAPAYENAIAANYGNTFVGQSFQKSVILKNDARRAQEVLPKVKQIKSGSPQKKINDDKRQTQILRKDSNTSNDTSRSGTAPQNHGINTDVLKKILKINETSNSKMPVVGDNEQQKASGKSISVDEVFAKAKVKPPSTHSNCMKLLSYYQANNLGCPQYQYFKNGNMFEAQLTLPDGTMFIGKQRKNREEASEETAYKALKHLIPDAQSFSKPKSPKVFPTPPQQWYQNSSGSKTGVNPALKNSTTRKDPTKQSPQKNMQFVPLQAVRNTPQTNRSVVKGQFVRGAGRNGTDRSKEENEKINAEKLHVDASPRQVKRRERKMRLAAAFGKGDVEVNS